MTIQTENEAKERREYYVELSEKIVQKSVKKHGLSRDTFLCAMVKSTRDFSLENL